MIVRSSKFLLLFLAATLLGAVVFAAVAAWQLSRGPIHLGFLTPYVEESLSGGPNGVQVRLHDTVLTWAGLERSLDLRAVGLEVLDSDGEVAAAVPEMSVQFSLRALLRGLVAPTGLELFGPRLRVVRTADGEMIAGFGVTPGNGQSGRGGMQLIDLLLQEPDPNSSTGYLRRVSVVSALIDFEDRQAERNWTAQRADISLERNERGIAAEGTITFDLGGGPVRFEVVGELKAPDGSLEILVSFDDVSPAAVASLDPRLSDLDRLKLPVSGTLAVSLSASLETADLNFDLISGAGEIELPEFYSEPLTVTQLALRGRAADALNSLIIDEAVVDLGGPVAMLNGTINRRDESIEFQLNARADTLPINDLSRLWPSGVAVNPRAWITKNIKDGAVNSASFALSGTTRADDIEAVVLRESAGQIDLEGATVHYLRPMTPVQGVSAVGRFDGVDLVFDIREAHLGDLKVGGGTVAIRGLTGPAPIEVAHIDVTIAGPTGATLALLDEKPLNFISPFGIDPAQASGTQTTKVVFKFPLLDALSVDEVEVAASARLENLSSPAGVFGANITDGNFDLSVDTQRLIATGEGALAGIPVNLTWTENFTDATKLRTRYEVQAILDDAARQTFGLDAGALLQGPVGVGLTYEIATDGAILGAASLNLNDATMSLEDFGWQKAPGQPGTGSVEFSGQDGSLREISKFAVETSEFLAEGRATLTGGGDGLEVSELDFQRLVVGETNLSLRIAFGDDGVPDVLMGGEKLDLRLPVKDAFAEGDGETPAMRVRFDPQNPLRAIRLGEETVLQNPVGRLAHNGEDWSDIDLRGTLSSGPNINLQLNTVEANRTVRIESDDGGGLLRALDWIKTIEGGALRVDGTFTNETFAGQLDLTDFRVNESSVAVRVLSLASLSGISDAVTGTGITMRRAEVPFEVNEAEIKIGNAKARGAGVGIIGSGSIDRKSDEIDLKGEIAPANVINSILGNIPLVSEIIGDGIIAVSFGVKGPLEDPGVSVNPLTALVPGVFRKAFSGFGDGKGLDEGSTEQPTPPPPGE